MNRWTKTDKILKSTLQEIRDIFKEIESEVNDLRSLDMNKNRLNRAIKEWSKLGLMNTVLGYYARKAKTNQDILKALIIGAYFKKLDELNDISNRVFKEVSNDITKQANKEMPFEVKPLSLTEIIGFALVLGVPFRDYLESQLFLDSQETYTKVSYSIAQDSPLDLKKDILKQSNRVLSINDNKFSGALHDISIKVGNWTYIKPLLKENHKVKFVAVLDQRTTPMCESMDGMIFNTLDLNSFDRETSTGLQHYEINGLVDGINLPPIIDFVHHCRSCLVFIE